MNKAEIVFNYVLYNFKLKFEVDDAFLKIDYVTDSGAKVRINNSGHGFFDKQINVEEQSVFFLDWKNRKLPFFWGNSSAELMSFSGDLCEINVDLIAGSFYFLSGWQEQFTRNNDRFGRFTYEQSIQKKLGVAILPVVNYYFDILKTAIEKTYHVQLKERIKGNFSAVLSHDIDELDTLWLQEGYHALKQGKFLAIPAIILNRLRKFNQINSSILRLLQVEKDYGIHSDFFFLCRKGQAGIYKNADYHVTDSSVALIIKEILAAGNSIGVHGSFHTHRSIENLSVDITLLKSVIMKEVAGNRFHFLNYDCSTTPSILQACNIKYDSTLGFAEHIGFRNSYANAFYLFDLKGFQSTQVIEFPLTLMDASLYFPQYMNCNYEQSVEFARELITEVEKVNGILVMNWHNSGYLVHKNGWLQSLLIAILNECKSKHSNFTTMGNLFNEFANLNWAVK